MVIALAPETFVIHALRAAGGRFSNFPTMAVTIEIRYIPAAKRIHLYVDGGTRQQGAIYQYVKGNAWARSIGLIPRYLESRAYWCLF